MSRRDPLDVIVRDASEELRAQLQETGRRRDFAAMVARARDLDPSSVSEADTAEATSFAPVVVLHGSAPPLCAPRESTPDRRPPRIGRGLVIAALGLAAALLLSLVSAAPIARRHFAALRGEAASHHVKPAPHRDRALLLGGGASTSPPQRSATRPLPEPTTSVAPDEAPQDPAAESLLPTSITSPPQEDGADPPPQASPLRRRSPENLDRSAREAWRRGELRLASALFRRFIATERDPKETELAFGDLLLVTRQLGDRRSLTQTRRDYLARFPSGAYAEDVRAELCRDGGGQACWSTYLERWPEGAHADEARRDLAPRGE